MLKSQFFASVLTHLFLFGIACSIGSLSGTVHTVPIVKQDSQQLNKQQDDHVALTRQMNRFVRNYIKENNESLALIKQKSAIHFAIIDSVMVKYGLPVDLKYLAVIESELKSSAVSPVGAVGPWQLMPVTAQQLGLKVNECCDERTHYYKSTKAAAIYLRDLYGQYGDWLLVLAAYNSGPGPVNHAIRMSGSHDFWRLQYYLPAESREHVKKFIATQYYFEGLNSLSGVLKQKQSVSTKA